MKLKKMKGQQSWKICLKKEEIGLLIIELKI